MEPLKKLLRQSPKFFTEAMEKGTIQFLNWSNTGSGKSPKKPPIRWGVLRGSASAFVGSKLVSIFTPNQMAGVPTPAKSNDAVRVTKGVSATWVWNTDYAKKMHEWIGGWGEFTLQDGDAGNKWLEDHLRADRNALMDMVAAEFKAKAGT